MKQANNYRRISSPEKVKLIKRYLDGESASKICRKNNISRTIFYRWLKEYNSALNVDPLEALSAKNPKGRKHWRRLKNQKERDVISLWKNNPDYSIRNIASKAQVSIGGAFKVIKQYKENAEAKGKEIRRYIKKNYNIYNPQHKIELIHRYHSGESIAKIARDAGISRTILYKWIRSFETTGNIQAVFDKHHAKGEKHWRFMPELREGVRELALKYPDYSLSKLVKKVKEQDLSISKSGLYYMLKRMELDTYPKRLAYVTASNTIVVHEKPILYFSQRIVMPALMSLIAVFALLYMFSFPFKIGTPFTAINTEPTQTQTETDTPEKTADNRPTAPQKAEQDFNWGALAINSPQSSYKTDEGIELGFGVVDHAGNTICDASVEFMMFSAKGVKVYDSGVEGQEVRQSGLASIRQSGLASIRQSGLASIRQSGLASIRQSGECSLQSVTSTPDYILNIPPISKEGDYEMRIKATTYEGIKEFSGKLLIRNSQPVNITRSKYPTRIFPRAAYPVEIEIKSEKDFQGTIVEELPKGLIASGISGEGILFRENQKNDRFIRWSVDLKKGNTYKLSYTLRFPMVWPEFYEIGPLKFISESGDLVYQEAKYWQVVADAL
jgi:transposase-like protein